MLQRYLMFVVILMCGFAIVAGGLVLVVGINKWYMLQEETQFIATTLSEYGGYTQLADNAINQFCQAKNFDPSELTVTVTPDAPQCYGSMISVSMKYPFIQVIQLGKTVLDMGFPMTTYSSVLSTFVPQIGPGGSPVQVVYMTPSFPR